MFWAIENIPDKDARGIRRQKEEIVIKALPRLLVVEEILLDV